MLAGLDQHRRSPDAFPTLQGRRRQTLRRQGRDCVHQSCAAVPSAYSTVVRRWLCSYSSRAQVPCLDLLAGLRLLLFGLLLVSLFGPFVFVGSLVAALLRPSRLVAPREGAVLVLSVLRFFVVLVDFVVEEFFLLSWVHL